MTRNVYFDHNATTPLDPVVREAMLPWLGIPANASSRHQFGRSARHALEQAREQVAAAVSAHPSQVVFTGSGTEADNFAIRGICSTLKPGHLAVSAIEHPAVMKPAQALLQRGWKLTKIAVEKTGKVGIRNLEEALQQPAALVSIMLANNETGVVQDIPALSGIARRHGAIMHTDAVQALGKMPLDFNAFGVQAMSLSGHKIGGPQGTGALVLDKRLDIQPLLYGGGQEKGRRSGTENIAAIVGFGMACELLMHRPKVEIELRDELEVGLRALGAAIFGAEAQRVPNTSFFAIPGIDGETLVMALDRAGYAVASGSACSSDSSDPSPVLLAMGISPELAQGAVRVSLGSGNTAQEIQGFLQALRGELSRMQTMSALAV
ncbi:MAG TPA: cysteine desulfurase family protein [Novimethylophilus sp.]|jgi:cysteine desulfurase|uniref:cysteine desulfurase family protein n=1 Tax=Novimethylophilus sp. TaxID=2137426 RepID=UPI002F405F92